MKIFESLKRKEYVEQKCKLYELSSEITEMLPEYVETMMNRKRDIDYMRRELKPFLERNTKEFMDWFFRGDAARFEVDLEKNAKEVEEKTLVDGLKIDVSTEDSSGDNESIVETKTPIKKVDQTVKKSMSISRKPDINKNFLEKVVRDCVQFSDREERILDIFDIRK